MTPGSMGANLTGIAGKAARKRKETALKLLCTNLLKKYGGFSFPIPPGFGSGKTGAPDRICYFESKVISCEFKVDGRDLSDGQKKIKFNIEATGNIYAVIRCEQDFREALGLPLRAQILEPRKLL